MSNHRFAVLATVALVSPALALNAMAQKHPGGGGGGGGGGAPAAHAAPPAAHFSAPPAAHFSAPPAAHFSAPAAHVAPPAAHFAAPHVAAPQHFAAPRAPQVQHFAAPHNVAPQHGRVGPSAPNFARGHNVNRPENLTRHAVTQPNGPRGNTRLGNEPNRANTRLGNVPNRANELHGPNQANQRGRNAPSTVGQGAATNRNAMQNARQNTRGNRILHNPTLANAANASSRNAAARNLANSTFRGRFAQSAFARNFDRRHHHRNFFVLGFVGPIFWPFAYDDFVDYTFWPVAYDTFWPYAYDDLYEGIWGGYAPEYGENYAYAGAPASSVNYSRANSSRAAYARGGANEGGGAPQVCSGDAQGLTDFPIDRIAQQVSPTQDQQGLLDDLKVATQKAVEILQEACPTDLPATPTGRLAAMRIRVQAMLDAVRTVRPALEKFYASLTDEQKERFNSLDQQAFTAASGQQQQAQLGQACGNRRGSLVNLPIGRIQQSLSLSDTQNGALQDLQDASAKAAEIMNANCPNGEQALTPPGRLAAMEQRLNGTLQAIETMRPALTKFYGSLNDEQKARFDRLGHQG